MNINYQDLTFADSEHKTFFEKHSSENKKDVYKDSLIYLLGISKDTRNKFTHILNEDGINRSVLNEGWVTGNSYRTLVLGFNLFNGFMAGTWSPEYDDVDLESLNRKELIEIIESNRRNAVDEIFDGELAIYYLQAVNMRFNINEKENRRQEFSEIIERQMANKKV